MGTTTKSALPQEIHDSIVELYLQGLSNKDIVKRCNVDAYNVKQIITMYNCHSLTEDKKTEMVYPKILVDYIIDLYRAGATVDQIVNAWSVDLGVVSYRIYLYRQQQKQATGEVQEVRKRGRKKTTAVQETEITLAKSNNVIEKFIADDDWSDIIANETQKHDNETVVQHNIGLETSVQHAVGNTTQDVSVTTTVVSSNSDGVSDIWADTKPITIELTAVPKSVIEALKDTINVKKVHKEKLLREVAQTEHTIVELETFLAKVDIK